MFFDNLKFWVLLNHGCFDTAGVPPKHPKSSAITLTKKCFSSLFHLPILKRPQGVEWRLISDTVQKKLLLNFQNSQMKKGGETLFGECILGYCSKSIALWKMISSKHCPISGALNHRDLWSYNEWSPTAFRGISYQLGCVTRKGPESLSNQKKDGRVTCPSFFWYDTD